jgi:DNA-binding MarR family transcriptional regulator
MESDWRGLAANQYQQCSGSTLQQRKDFCNRLTPGASQAALNTREIAAGVTSLVARLDGHNKGVYTPNMESEEVDFVACRQCVCTAARRRSRELTRLFEKAMRGSGVRGTQFTLLATLVQTGPLPTTRLADFQGLERTTLTRNLARLVRDGFVRIDEGEDRRVRKVAITPAGEEAARRAYPFWKKAQDAALAPAAPPSAPS